MARPNLLGLLLEADRWGDQTASSRHRGLRLERWSWSRLRCVAFRVARELKARGVERGDRVVLRAPAGPEWVAGFWGCLLRGAIVVPLDVDSPRHLVERAAHQVDPRLTMDRGLLGGLAAGADGEGGPAPTPPGVGRGDLAEIVFTSGTTSEPKGVCLTHGNLLSNVEPFEEQIHEHARLARLFSPLRFLSPLPLTHVYGQISAVFVPPFLGAEVHFPHCLKARELVESVMPCVPRQLDVLAQDRSG